MKAQGYYEFLGSPRSVADKLSARHGIRYNTQGYDKPDINWTKRERKLTNKGVPAFALNEMMQFPGGADAIGEWIDQAFDEVQTQFKNCGSLAGRAASVSPSSLYVTITPSAFFEPYYNVDVAGVYYPSTHEIRVLNIYYTWSGPHAGWLRHSRESNGRWGTSSQQSSECKQNLDPMAGLATRRLIELKYRNANRIVRSHRLLRKGGSFKLCVRNLARWLAG